MVERLRTLWSSPLKGDGGLSMAALTVEHLKVLLVEHLKVLISRACLRILNSRACWSIQFTYWVGGLWSSASGPYGRAPDGPYGRACLRILTSRACLRTLKVQLTYWALKYTLRCWPVFLFFADSSQWNLPCCTKLLTDVCMRSGNTLGWTPIRTSRVNSSAFRP